MNFFDYLIKKQSVKAKLEASDWEDAIRKGGEKLIEAKACKAEYIDGIVKTCRENNAAFVIAPGIAMPHTRPECGALDNGFALVTLKNPVNFGDAENDPIRLLLFIAGKDNNSHIDAVEQIGDFCASEDDVAEICNLETEKEILSFLKKMKKKF